MVGVVMVNTRYKERRRSEIVREMWKKFVGEVLTFKTRNVKTLWIMMTVMRITARTYRATS